MPVGGRRSKVGETLYEVLGREVELGRVWSRLKGWVNVDESERERLTERETWECEIHLCQRKRQA